MALAAVSALALAACGGSDDPEGEDGKSITIGIANEQPYGYMGANGEATGFAPDVAREVLSNMGYTDFEFKVVEFGQLISGLKAQQFDMVAAGMYINPDRMKQIQFSDPDYCVHESLAVPEGNPESVTDYTSLEDTDLTVAVATGTAEISYLEDAGIPQNRMKTYPAIDQMYDALENGEVDVVTGTDATVNAQVAGRDGIEAVEKFLPVDPEGNDVYPCGGYGFRLEDTELRDDFNEELNKLREDGTTKEIITSYEGITEEDVDLANERTVADFEE